MGTHRFLCFGDNHGDADSLRRVAEGTTGESFDYIVHTGDFSNLFFDGYPTAQDSLDEMAPHLETLSERGDFVYVFGNRDARGLNRVKDADLPAGSHVPEEGVAEVGELAFAQQPPPREAVDRPVVRVTHHWRATAPRFDGLLSLSGDTHNGRSNGNIVDTGFLYRTDDHGADAVYGCYTIIEIDEDGSVDVEFHPIGDVDVRTCSQHSLLGEQFVVPAFWNQQCHFCYDEDDYFDELQWAVLTTNASQIEDDFNAEMTGKQPKITSEMIDEVEGEFPRPFRPSERAELVGGEDTDAEQSGLSDF